MLEKKTVQTNFWNIVFFLLLLLLVIVTAVLIMSAQPKEGKPTNTVGAVFIGSIEDGGWNQSHYEGLKEACNELGEELVIAEHVAEDLPNCMEAVATLVEDRGCDVVFLTSDGFGSNVKPVVDKYPKVFFYTISPKLKAPNANMYYGRIYQVRYLAGMLAASKTRTNVLGFVAAKRNPQVNRDVNAYLLGARCINPDVVVKVRLTGTWLDEEKEREAAEKLIDEGGADVIAYHSSESTAIEVAEERGVYSVGYGRQAEHHDNLLLTSVVFRWKALYCMIIQDFLGGKTKLDEPYWRGVSDGVVSIGQFSPMNDRETYRRMREVKASYEDGWDVFMGEIRRRDGKVMCRRNERIGDEALLLDMDWFVKGVIVEGDD